MSTGGNLVFQGRAVAACTHSRPTPASCLHKIDTGVGIMAAPMTYEVAGVQYVAVMAGYGGGAIATTYPDFAAGSRYLNEGRIIALKLGGGPVPLPPARPHAPRPAPPAQEGSAVSRAAPASHRAMRALSCPWGERAADLRITAPADLKEFENIVLYGRSRPWGWGTSMTCSARPTPAPFAI